MAGTATKLRVGSGTSWDFPALVQVLYILVPLQFLMIFIGDSQVTFALILGGIIGAFGIVLLASSRMGLHLDHDRSILYGFLFTTLCAFGIATTPYGAPAISKGLTNLFAVVLMLSMAMVVARTVTSYPGLFQHLVRISMYATGATAITGVLQFFIANVLGAPDAFNLTALSTLSGAVWWQPAIENGLTRAHGVYEEPSFLAAYIGFTTGIAFLRVGIFGKERSEVLHSSVPLWTAWSIILCMILTLSPVCYAAMMFGALGIIISSRKFRLKTILAVVLSTIAMLGVGVAVALKIGGSVLGRFTSLVIFADISGRADPTVATHSALNVSTVTLFMNAVVAVRNWRSYPFFGVGMGGHPFAYDAFLPNFSAFGQTVMDSGHIITLNKMDAASLFLRLISETGSLGILIFTVMFASAFLRARRWILRNTEAPGEMRELAVMSIGLNGALLGLFVAHMLRVGVYYNPPLWTLFALCVAIPQLGKSGSSYGNEVVDNV